MSAAVAIALSFESITCGGCGVAYAMTSTFIEARRADHKTFYCPNGCQRAYLGKTKAEELQEQLDRANRAIQFQKDQRAMLEKSNAALRGQVTKNKNKLVAVSDSIAKGVCPCCNRSFENLRRHMASKHPDFVKKLEAEHG